LSEHERSVEKHDAKRSCLRIVISHANLLSGFVLLGDYTIPGVFQGINIEIPHRFLQSKAILAGTERGLQSGYLVSLFINKPTNITLKMPWFITYKLHFFDKNDSKIFPYSRTFPGIPGAVRTLYYLIHFTSLLHSCLS
jgi:hypothetical protein